MPAHCHSTARQAIHQSTIDTLCMRCTVSNRHGRIDQHARNDETTALRLRGAVRCLGLIHHVLDQSAALYSVHCISHRTTKRPLRKINHPARLASPTYFFLVPRLAPQNLFSTSVRAQLEKKTGHHGCAMPVSDAQRPAPLRWCATRALFEQRGHPSSLGAKRGHKSLDPPPRANLALPRANRCPEFFVPVSYRVSKLIARPSAFLSAVFYY